MPIKGLSKSAQQKQKRAEYWSAMGRRDTSLSEYYASLLKEYNVIVVCHGDKKPGTIRLYSAINTKRGAIIIK